MMMIHKEAVSWLKSMCSWSEHKKVCMRKESRLLL